MGCVVGAVGPGLVGIENVSHGGILILNVSQVGVEGVPWVEIVGSLVVGLSLCVLAGIVPVRVDS